MFHHQPCYVTYTFLIVIVIIATEKLTASNILLEPDIRLIIFLYQNAVLIYETGKPVCGIYNFLAMKIMFVIPVCPVGGHSFSSNLVIVQINLLQIILL